MPAYFGRPRQAQGFKEMQPVDWRRGLSCAYCTDPISEDQDGVIDDDRTSWHAVCWLLQKLRMMSPSAGAPGPGESRYAAAKKAVEEFEGHATLGARTPAEIKADDRARDRALEARERADA